MNMIGVGPAANRNAIIADLLSEGLDGLKHMTDEEVRDTCASYAKRTDGPCPVILTPVLKQHIKSLVLWVKDQGRVGQALAFSGYYHAGAVQDCTCGGTGEGEETQRPEKGGRVVS